jgi:hypothetical protein
VEYIQIIYEIYSNYLRVVSSKQKQKKILWRGDTIKEDIENVKDNSSGL